MSKKNNTPVHVWPPIPSNHIAMIHKLKTLASYYEDVENGSKTFELRRFDRTYTVGDYLCLQEYKPEEKSFTGRFVFRRVVYLLSGKEAELFGLKPGFCVLGLAPVTGRLRPTIGGGGLEQFTASDYCPCCGDKLDFEAGWPQTYEEPGQSPAVFCPSCGLDFPIDWDRLIEESPELYQG